MAGGERIDSKGRHCSEEWKFILLAARVGFVFIDGVWKA
jgi:hypothetical protein